MGEHAVGEEVRGRAVWLWTDAAAVPAAWTQHAPKPKLVRSGAPRNIARSAGQLRTQHSVGGRDPRGKKSIGE